MMCSTFRLRAVMLDAGVDLRDVQIAARHADPRTTMRYAELNAYLRFMGLSTRK